MAEQVRLGIVGLGAQGSTYARLITDGMVPNMKIGAICTSNPAKAEVVGSTYPGVEFYLDYSTMLGSGDVDAVVICVPPYLHPEMAIAALERDIHALVEKPAGVYTNRCVS
jgi:predicted dehydrogenase